MAKAPILSVLFATFGCVATPRPEDAAAPRDFYAQLKPEHAPPCSREIRLLDEGATLPEHVVLSRVSVTCSPGSPAICERKLRQRACEIEADAIVLEPARSGGVPSGASSQSLIARTGRVLRWR